MARAGLAYAAMLAASVSAGALGYAVIWAYAPEEPIANAPTVRSAVAPVEVAAQPGPPGIVTPVVPVPPRAAAPEPVTVAPPAIATASVEPAAPPASGIPAPRVGVAPTPVAEPPKSQTPAVLPQ